jgi:hypothetical protein
MPRDVIGNKKKSERLLANKNESILMKQVGQYKRKKFEIIVEL